MSKFQYFLNKHSTQILTVVASSGVILTTVLAVKATPKALELLKEAKEQKGSELTTFEKVKYGWKPYIYCYISCLGTICCIYGIEYLNKRKQSSLISAYMLLDNSYRLYRNNVIKNNGKETDNLSMNDIITAKYDPKELMVPENDEDLLFFDYQSMRFFWSSFHNVIKAENELLEALHYRGYANLNEYYRFLGVPEIKYGDMLGWWDFENNDLYNLKELEFNYEKMYVGENNDVECWIITTNVPTSFEYIY